MAGDRDYNATIHRSDGLDARLAAEIGFASVTPHAGPPTLHSCHHAGAMESTGDWYHKFEYAASDAAAPRLAEVNRKFLIMAALAAAFFWPARLAAQPEWTFLLVEPRGEAPSARLDAPPVYDEPGRRLLVFGGQDTGARNDLWAFSLATREWVELNPSGDRPPARWGHTSIFDPVRRRLIVFGGQSSGFFSDTWAYDIARNSWSQLSLDGAGPSRRYGHSAIYDPAGDRMIISHGFTDRGRFDDTWAYRFAGAGWQNLTPTGGKPLRRCLHHAVLDAANRQMLLYGGCASGNGPCPLDDLWSFHLDTHQWTERVTSRRPPGREWYGMTFDSLRQRLWIFGGSGGGSRNDLWEYDPAANIWTEIPLEDPAPAPRSRHEGIFIADLGLSYFFGGRTTGGLTNDLLALAPRPRFSTNGVANAFSGQPGAVSPGEIVSIFGVGLGPAAGIATTFDSEGRLPTAAGGVSVSVNGVPAPLYFVRSDQLNVQMPYELAGEPRARIIVSAGGVSSPAVEVPVAPARPGLFPRAFHEDGSLNSADNPAPPGSIAVMFGTGSGVTNPPTPTGRFPIDQRLPPPAAPTSVRIGGRDAEILFRGQTPGTAGVIQVNFRIPRDQAPDDAVPVTLVVGGAESQPGVTIAVK